jgi:hypothetical protein
VPLDPLGPLAGVSPFLSNVFNQVVNLVTGVMTDQPVTLADGLTVKGGITSSTGITSSAFSQDGVLYGTSSGGIAATAAGSSNTVLASTSSTVPPAFTATPTVTSITTTSSAQIGTKLNTSSALTVADGGANITGGLSGVYATPTIALSSVASAGAATTTINSDATIAAFDATVPGTETFGQAAATGSVAFAARRDHAHGVPTPDVVMLADTTLGSAATNITFTSISASYKHLRIILQTRGDTAGTVEAFNMQFNGDSSTNYDQQRITGNNATPSAAAAAAQTSLRCGVQPGAGAARGAIFGSTVIDIPNYAGTTAEKSFVSTSASVDSTAANCFTECDGGSRRNSSALNAVKFIPGGSVNFVTGSRGTVYGAK